MFKQKIIVLLAIVSQVEVTICEIRTVPCKMSQSNQNCTISGLTTLTLENYKFKPNASLPNNVINFDITKSIVPVITSDICTTLPKIKTFIAINQGIEIIEDYAFNNCTKVTSIRMFYNNIHKMGKGIFSETRQLQVLNIHGASLEPIDVDLFSNLNEMLTLVFSANGLKQLPLESIKHMKKLKTLYLYSNDLFDLDAEGFTQNLPSLESIFINDNNFLCHRLTEIVNAFKAKGITVSTSTLDSYMKKRDYIPGKRDGIICVTEAQKKVEDMKRGLTMSLDDLKDYPIGKAVIQLNKIVYSEFAEADSNIVDLVEIINTLNQTSENLNQKIAHLNEKLEKALNVTTTKVQEIANAVTSVDTWYREQQEERNRWSVSLGHAIAIWVFLILLMCAVTATIIFLHKNLRHARLDVPILSYKNGSECLLHNN